MLEIKVRDWGPKPFRSLNAWLFHLEFKTFITRKWQEYSVNGWGAFVVKEKLKMLKEDLKVWNREVFGHLDFKIEKHKSVIEQLDVIDEVFGLEEDEYTRRQEAIASLYRDFKWRNNMLAQKSRSKWIKEGDSNTRFFHSCINRRKKRN